MKKLLLVLLVSSAPVLFFFYVRQVYLYKTVETEVSRYEEKQREWLEANKQLVAGIALLSSPERIEKLALEELGLDKVKQSQIIHLFLPPKKGGPDG